jgi:hypothetical protein
MILLEEVWSIPFCLPGATHDVDEELARPCGIDETHLPALRELILSQYFP